jgi:hypothetical protein
VRKRHRITVIRCRTRHPSGSPVLITRTQHHDADGTLLQYAETITPPGTEGARARALHEVGGYGCVAVLGLPS